MSNQDWLDELLDQFDPINISHHDFERLKPQAKAKLEALLRRVEVEARKDELKRTIAFFGEERPKWESEKVLEAFVDNRIIELEGVGL